MTRHHLLIATLALAGAASVADTARAQSLAERVRRVGTGRAELRYTARPGVCGDGSRYIRLGDSYMGSFDSNTRDLECMPGPVRVLLGVTAGRVTDVRTYVGPERRASGGESPTDLGAVAAPEAAAFLLEVAATADGRAAEKAIFPAVLADSAVVWPRLLAIARDSSDRPRSARNTAAFWLGRFASAAQEGHPNDLTRDEDEPSSDPDVEARKAAVFALSQLRGREGIAPLVTVARTNRNPAVRRQALFWLGQSGDARALELFEEILRKGQ